MTVPDPWYVPYERAADRGAVMQAACFGCMYCAPERYATACDVLARLKETYR